MKINDVTLLYYLFTFLAGVANNQVSNTPNDICPTRCTCTDNYTVVDCSNGALNVVPRDVPVTVKKLDLSRNLINFISHDVFRNLSNLTVLLLNGNSIQTIADDLFIGLFNLTVLDLGNTGLQQLSSTVFRDLNSLLVLHLEGNFFRSIPNLTYPRNLIELSVGNCDMKSADLPSSLQLLTSLRTFSVSVVGNPLKIDKNYFKWLTKNIKKLAVVDGGVVELGDLDRCLFNDLQEFIWDTTEAGLSELQETLLSLGRCSKLTVMVLIIFNEVPTLPANAFESLQYLKLQNLTLNFSVQTSVISAGAFPYMPDLHHLSLYVITLKELQDTLSGMTNLVTFRMENEEMEMLPRFELLALREFTFSCNKGLKVCTGGIFIQTNLTFLDMSGNSLQRIESDCLDGLRNLETLDLSRNKISSIHSSVFEDMPNLLFLNLQGNRLYTLYPCYLSPLHRLHSLDVSFNRILCLRESVEQEPCFSSLGSLQKLDISHNSLGNCLAIPNFDRPFEGLKALEALSLGGNSITMLPPKLLDQMPSLKRLDLPDNFIVTLDNIDFPSSFADISFNKISIVPSEVIRRIPPNLQLKLTNNSFACSCDLIPFFQWIAEEKVNESRLVELPEYTCSSPADMYGIRLLDVKLNDVIANCFPPPWKIIVVAVACCVAVVMTVCSVLIYRFRWPLRLRLYYVTKRYRSRLRPAGYEDIENDADGYDLMVSCLADDEGGMWVREVLTPTIDKKERTRRRSNVSGEHAISSKTDDFVLFVADRDLSSNETSIGVVIDAMRKARKVMLVVTNSYLKDSKCRYEMDYAVFKSVSADHGVDDVIAVLFEESVDVRLLSSLHRSLKLNEVLHWTPNDESGTRLFWEKLKDRLTQDCQL